MADIQSNISVNIDTSNALANLKALQGQISAFHQTMSRSGALAASEMSKLQNGLMNSLNRSGQFDARLKTIKTTTESFTEALEKNKMSMGQYFRYAGAATKDFGRFFGREFDTIEKVARERVKDLQTQYIKLGRDANGAMKSIAIRPLMLDLEDMGTKTQIAAQKQQLLNQLLKQGSTNMLNWGKNTQWAGRQLMVGFTIPLTMLGQIAGKTFMDMEEQVIKFQRVYGDFSTTAQQTREMTTEVTNLAKAFTKYGLAVSDTMGMAADAAAMGKMGADLLAQVESASRLAVLGGVDQKQALETTISLTNAFGIAAEDLTSKINFLNVVENQTVTSIEDLTIAVPKAGPVIEQLGGSVEDLAFFLTAMKEGGINASEGANALKSGLASIINPTKKASDMLAGMGININKIVQANKGDVKGIVVEFGEALNQLDPLKRAQAIEQLFGKFQFARLSTLFKNVTDVNSQASKVAELAAAGPQASAILAQRELKKIEESPMFKFKKALEDLKAELVPLGEQFLKMVTPIANFITKLLEGFNNLSSGTRDTIGQIALWLGGFGPVLIMTIGLIANGVANMIKVFATIKGFLNGVGKGTQDLGSQTSFMTQKQIEAAAVASSLDQVHAKLRQTFTAEAEAVALLASQLERAVNAQRAFGWTPGATPAAGAGKGRKKFANGGMVRGPGGPKDDLVPTDLSNGEAVIDAATVKKNPRIISALFAGKKINIPGYADSNSGMFPAYTNAVAYLGSDTNQKLKGSGLAAGDLAAEIRALGPGMNAPIVETVARSLGATNNKQIIEMLRNDPRLREFATDIQVGVANAVEAQGGKVNDPALGKIYQEVARREAVARGKAFADATETFLTQPTTIEDPTIQRISSSDPNKTRSVGRKSLFQGVRSYRAINYRPIASELGTDPTGLVKAHMSERTFVNVREAAKKFGVELSRAAQDAAARMEAGITTTYQSVAKAVKKATRQASPSKDAAEAGENIGIGAIQGIKEGGKEAKSAGRAIGTSVRTQAQQDALMVASRTKAAYKNDSTLNMLTIQRKQAEMMGANTAAIEQEILARRATIAAQVKEQVATESAARIKASQPFTGSAPLPAGYQGPIGPNDKRKGVGFGSKIAAGAKNIGGKIMGGGIGASMGIGAAGMAVGMIPGMEGVGQAISMASMIPMLLPMLMNPIGATVAALGLLTVGIFALNAAQEENRKKQIALGNASVMSTNKMIEISKSLGTVSATESRQSKRANIAGISQENQSQASTFMESEAGKQFVTDINSQKDAGKTDKEVAESTSRDLANLVLQGVMDEGMAKAILQDSAAKTGNYELSNSMGNLSTLVEGGATAASGAALKSAETATSKGYFGEMKYGNSFISLKDVPKLQAASIETANAFSQITGQQDVLASQFETGKISLEDYRSGMKELQSDQAKAIDLANTQQRVLGSEYDTTFMQNVKDTFGEESPAYKTAEKLKEIGDSDFKTSMMLNLESGQMTPDQVNQLLDMGTSAQTNFQATVDLIGQGPTLDLMTRLTQQGYTALEIQTVLANPQQAKEITDTLTLIEDLTSDGPITMETLIKKDSQFASLKSEADWFNSLPAVQQRYFLSIYKTIKDSDVSGNIAKKKGIIDKNGNITMSADRAEKKITKADMDKERTRLAKADTVKEIKAGTFNEVGGDGGGGGGTTDKASAALSILGRKEEKINKAYDERLKALDKIQQANEKINQQKKDQLDLADALSKGDIGAAARAQQQARENAQATALQQQRDQMNAAKEAQIAALRVNGMSREQLEAYQANEANKKDLSALGKWAGAKGFAIGGMVPKTQYFSIGGKPKGTDTISAMLTPGEFVVKKSAVDKLGAGTMKKINNGQLPGGNSVYNYSISVNVKSDADADQIANAVLTKIQKIDNQAMRGDKA